MTAPPLSIGAGALGGVRDKARRHQLECGRFRGGEDEHSLLVSLLGSAAHNSVVVSLLCDESNSFLQSSSTSSKLVLGHSLHNLCKSS